MKNLLPFHAPSHVNIKACFYKKMEALEEEIKALQKEHDQASLVLESINKKLQKTRHELSNKQREKFDLDKKEVLEHCRKNNQIGVYQLGFSDLALKDIDASFRKSFPELNYKNVRLVEVVSPWYLSYFTCDGVNLKLVYETPSGARAYADPYNCKYIWSRTEHKNDL